MNKEKQSREDLQNEIKDLKQEVQQLKAANKITTKSLDIAWRAFVGRKLNSSLNNFLKECKNQSFTTETLSDLIAAVLSRIIRVAIIPFILILISPILLFQQNQILKNQSSLLTEQITQIKQQNNLLDTQNIKFEEQNSLAEAERRSALIFELSSILDKIDEELQVDNDGNLSTKLIGRIRALSTSLRPYKYLDKTDKMRKNRLSPERAQLLISILNSELSDTAYRSIFQSSNFSYSDLRDINLTVSKNKTLYEINLENSDLSSVNFSSLNMTNTNLRNTDLRGANMKGCTLKNVDFSSANMIGANLKKCKIENINLAKAKLIGLELDSAQVNSKTWFEDIECNQDSNKPIDLDSIKVKYKIEHHEGSYLIIKK